MLVDCLNWNKNELAIFLIWNFRSYESKVAFLYIYSFLWIQVLFLWHFAFICTFLNVFFSLINGFKINLQTFLSWQILIWVWFEHMKWEKENDPKWFQHVLNFLVGLVCLGVVTIHVLFITHKPFAQVFCLFLFLFCSDNRWLSEIDSTRPAASLDLYQLRCRKASSSTKNMTIQLSVKSHCLHSVWEINDMTNHSYS